MLPVDIILTMGALIGVGLIAAFHVGLSKSLRASRPAPVQRDTSPMDEMRFPKAASRDEPVPSDAQSQDQTALHPSLPTAEPSQPSRVTFDPVTRVATAYGIGRMPPEVEAFIKARLAGLDTDMERMKQFYAALAVKQQVQSAAMAITELKISEKDIAAEVDSLRRLLDARQELAALVKLGEGLDGPRQDLLERVEAEIKLSEKSLRKSE